MAERNLAGTRLGFGAIGGRLRPLALGTLTGVVAGMGEFMFLKEQFLPWVVTETWALALVAVAGAYTHFLAKDLAESITLSLVAMTVGLTVHVVAWIAPLWLLAYPPGARDLLLPKMVGEAIASGLPPYVITFYGSYFAALLLGGYLEG
ncbi:hypothetical protein M0R88_14050 [Halorussus gelatinilyticus]|uniref:Uncharacterized protein n=1 Tax=Halorussus gelatinilyticus TaxID=2937524 RepID=A0A8U0IF85_9EURY|nr:hypothetical protein [Halorussus gelatinilyticus]UPV99632.1 hypothetical protein M0R88_14050 [Halorussus gelatinilyticus]